MDLDLTDDQRLLKDSIDGLTNRRYADLKARTVMMKEPKGYSAELWQEFATQGLLAIPFAEADGGLGGGPVEMMLAGEAIGRTLALEPFMATVVLSGGLLRHAASAEMRAKLVPDIVSGAVTYAFAHQEKQARFDLADVGVTAKSDGRGGFTLEGEKCVVLYGDSADKLIVSARISGDRRAKDGIGLFLIDSKAQGASRRGYPTQDGQRAADITLASVKVGADSVIGTPGQALPAIDRTVDEAIAFLAAEAVGAMEVMQALTLDYVKTRKQFGVAIGSFQVIQHKSVDMFTALEQARSMAYLATMMASEDNADERRRSISAAKVQIGRSARFVGEAGIQLHGGIGMTMEYKAGHYFKRLTMIEMAFGNSDHHLRLLAKAGGLIPAAA